MEPWIFDKFLVVLKEVNGDDVHKSNGWCLTPSWIQAHNLPIIRGSREDWDNDWRYVSGKIKMVVAVGLSFV